MTVWVISEKKISCKPISKKKISRKKIPTLKKKSFMVYNSGKKILHLCMSGKKTLSPEVWETNYYPKQITHSPLPPSSQKSNGKNLSFGSLSSQRVHSEFACITGRYWKLLLVFIRTGEERPIERYKARLKFQKEHRTLSTFKKNAIDFLCLNTQVRKFGLRPFHLTPRQKQRQIRKLFFIDPAAISRTTPVAWLRWWNRAE